MVKAKEEIAKLEDLKPSILSVDECLSFCPYSRVRIFFKLVHEKRSLDTALHMALDLPQRLWDNYCDFYCDKLDEAEGVEVRFRVYRHRLRC